MVECIVNSEAKRYESIENREVETNSFLSSLLSVNYENRRFSVSTAS